MARRFQEITEVYRQEIAALARADRWTAFLRSACRNYKLPFEEQVLVHAQRPDATAVLEIERWNRQFGRWVNKGATGIAVFDRDYPGRTRLKYYFDISDTHESRLSRPVPLWQVPTEQEPDVIEALENRFGALDDKGTLEEAIVSAMENAAADNMTDYLDDLQNCRDNSLLEELDELNLSVLYRRLLENSTAYMLMCRCGLEPDEYFDPEDFSEVFNFNTPETLNALGVATRDIAESGLSAIALTVRSRQKQIRTIAQAPENEYPIDKQTETQTERSENHGTDIHDEGRLPAAGSAAAAGAGNSPSLSCFFLGGREHPLGQAYSSLLIAFTSFQLLTYPPERLQFQRISIQLVLHIYVGFINIFDSGFFCHAYNKIFLCYAHSQAKNYTAWDPFHHHRRLHNAASYHSPFFIVFMALFFD